MPRTTSSDPDRPQLPTIDHVKGKAADKLLDHAWPVLAWLLMLPAARIVHANWGGLWAAGFTGFCGAVIILLSIKISHTRGMVTRILTPATVTCAFTWLTAADITGVTHKLTGIWFIGGGTLAAAWALHTHHHATPGQGVALSLEQAHARAGMRGIKVLSMMLHPKKRTGVMRLPGGKLTADDVAKQTTYVEGAAGLPPGALIITPNEDNAQHADWVLTDPRVLKKSHDWPGPSAPGQSIAEPIRPGIWQDGEDIAYRIVGHHLQAMGMTGAGKSTGQAWNEIAETVTRCDAAVFGVDVTKGRQFLGPLAPALHGLITEPEQIPEFFSDVHACVKDRANFLAEHGHTKWVEGCGLTHISFQLEEAPDTILLLGKAGDEEGYEDLDEHWMSDVKAIRSAGGRWIISLQRSDFTQMPTLARGQLAKQCFGVESAGDADFGLSELQKNRNCQPELWTTSYPGKFFLDGPTIEEKRKAMPARSYYWGEQTGPGSPIAAHAAAYPATARPLDPITARHLGKWLPAEAAAYAGVPVMPGCPGVPDPPRGGGGQPAPVDVVPLSAARSYRGWSGQSSRPPAPAPQPQEEPAMNSIWTAAPDPEPDDDEALGPVPAQVEYDDQSPAAAFQGGGDPDTVPALTADQARDRFLTELERLAERKDQFNIGDIIGLEEKVGRSRPWLYTQLGQAVQARLLKPATVEGLKGWAFPKTRSPAGVSAGSDT